MESQWQRSALRTSEHLRKYARQDENRIASTVQYIVPKNILIRTASPEGGKLRFYYSSLLTSLIHPELIYESEGL